MIFSIDPLSQDLGVLMLTTSRPRFEARLVFEIVARELDKKNVFERAKRRRLVDGLYRTVRDDRIAKVAR